MLFGKKRTPKVGGMIGYLGLQDFYRSLSTDEQFTLKEYYDAGLNPYSYSPKSDMDDSDFINGEIYGTSMTRLKYFFGAIGTAASENRFELADRLIKEGEKYLNEGLIDAHFFLQTTAECYYKQRDVRSDALDLCIEYCKKDIKLFPKYSKEMLKKYKEIPRIVTFQRLAIIYENQQRYRDAIDICKLALKYNLTDSTKGGYEGRLEKLKRKNKKEIV